MGHLPAWERWSLEIKQNLTQNLALVGNINMSYYLESLILTTSPILHSIIRDVTETVAIMLNLKFKV